MSATQESDAVARGAESSGSARAAAESEQPATSARAEGTTDAGQNGVGSDQPNGEGSGEAKSTGSAGQPSDEKKEDAPGKNGVADGAKASAADTKQEAPTATKAVVDAKARALEQSQVVKDYSRVDRWGCVAFGEDAKNEPPVRSAPPTRDEMENQLMWARMVGKWSKYKNPSNIPKIKSRVRKGIADIARGDLWPQLCGATIMQKKYPGAYRKCLARKLSDEDEVQLHKDLHRTDPKNIMFFNAGMGRESLYNVLRAYCNYNSDIGYCQGMGSLASLFLSYVPEETAFWMIERLMADPRYACGGLYSLGFPQLMKDLAVYDGLIKAKDPKLFKALQDKHIFAMTYAFRWFQGRFYEFPKELFVRITDIYLLEGRKIVFKLALYLMITRRNQFIKLPEEEAQVLARDIRDDPYTEATPDAASLVKSALKVKLSRETLRKYGDAYDKKMGLTESKGRGGRK